MFLPILFVLECCGCFLVVHVVVSEGETTKLDQILSASQGVSLSEIQIKGITKKENHNEKERPVIFITHMEHHSNQTSWYETTSIG